MAKPREIAQLGSEVLRKIATPVVSFTALDVLNVIEDMHATLDESDGVGIAAPQIFESICIVIIASRPTPRYPNAPVMEPTVMMNPSFLKLTAAREKDWEGCLSVPGIRALVPRYKDIEVTFQNTEGQQQKVRLSGFPARVFQHEYDHLNGYVYLDRVENNRDIISEKEFYKLISL